LATIEQVIEHMDRLIMQAEDAGRVPLHFMVRQSDWIEIGKRFRANNLPDMAAIGRNTYRGVPIHMSALSDSQIAGLVDGAGNAIFEER
jgi:hypothetical protein